MCISLAAFRGYSRKILVTADDFSNSSRYSQTLL